MIDNQNREEEVLEETNQVDPATEVQAEDPGQDQEPEQQPSESETDATEEQSEEETNEVEEAEIPKDNAAWAKLRTENKALKQAVEQSGVDAEYLKLLRQANQPSEVDYVSQVNQQPEYQNDQVAQFSAQALQEVRSLKNELEFEQDKAAREKHADLFANPQFEALVAEKKLVARVLGQKRTTREIADEVAQFFNSRNEQVQAQTEAQVQQRLAQKSKATAEPFTTSSAGAGGTDYDKLSDRARRGDINAQEQLVRDKLLADINF